MHKLSFHETSPAGRLFCSLTMTALAVLVALECAGATAWAQTAEKRTDPAVRPEFREPVTLTSKDGILEVRLTARQGQASLDTVATPVQNFLLFDYELIRGTASDGRKSGGYAGPLSINNTRGLFQFIPSNLQRFTAADKADSDVP